MAVRLSPFAKRADTEAVFTKIGAALALIRRYAPRRFAHLQQDMSGGILLFAAGSYLACWIEPMRLCELDDAYVQNPKTTTAALASTLVHEAMHARLYRRGFGYQSAEERVRVESACSRAEYHFALRLPGELGPRMAEEAKRTLRWLQDADAATQYYSNDAFLERQLRALRDLGCPEWLLRALLWLRNSLRRRRTQSITNSSAIER